MSMGPEQEDFTALRRLLAVKRHEQPPPGYFNSFSRQVISRIEAGEERQTGGLRWFQWLWAALDTRPALAGAFGATACVALLGGVFLTDGSPSGVARAFVPAISAGGTGLGTIADNHASTPAADGGSVFAVAPGSSALTASLPQPQQLPSLFESMQLPHPETVSWTSRGGN